jgi:phage tail tape-measure protein
LAIVKEKLPGLISVWSRGAGTSGEQCQQALRELFVRVQQQVATATLCKRLVLQSVDPTAARRGEAPTPVQTRRRVPLNDIPGMLDALDERERESAFGRQNFPSNTRRPQPALALG